MAYTFTDPDSNVATFYRSRSQERLRTLWQYERRETRLEYLGTTQSLLLEYGGSYTSEHDLQILTQDAYNILLAAYVAASPGTWSDGTTSYHDVIIDALVVHQVGSANDYRWIGNVKFRRAGG